VPKFAANLDWMFCELPFLERIGAAAAAGFQAVEFLFPYSYPACDIANALERHGLINVLFNLPAGDWSAGERGIAALPGRESEFRKSVELAISYASKLKTPQLHVLSGILPMETQREQYYQVYLANLRQAATMAATHGINLLIEAINPTDMPNYLIQTQAQSSDICTAVDQNNVKMQLDLYHLQMTGGNLATTLKQYRGIYSHVQIASVPGRNEPDFGEINYTYLFNLLDELGYAGWVGCEYKPRHNTLDGLGWFENQPRE
jgi:2-dehydrotetronate isomerase